MGKSLMVQPVRGWVRVDGVDCLRSLAIFYVLLNHVNMHSLFMSLHYLRNVPPAVANAVVWQGQAGVQIFLMKETNRSLSLVPLLFLAVIALAGALGELVGRFYSEPLNRAIRKRFLRVPTEAGPVPPIEQARQVALP
jgi:peptidoglycan/LPS O-acetylase OafA/YrhL